MHTGKNSIVAAVALAVSALVPPAAAVAFDRLDGLSPQVTMPGEDRGHARPVADEGPDTVILGANLSALALRASPLRDSTVDHATAIGDLVDEAETFTGAAFPGVGTTKQGGSFFSGGVVVLSRHFWLSWQSLSTSDEARSSAMDGATRYEASGEVEETASLLAIYVPVLGSLPGLNASPRTFTTAVGVGLCASVVDLNGKVTFHRQYDGGASNAWSDTRQKIANDSLTAWGLACKAMAAWFPSNLHGFGFFADADLTTAWTACVVADLGAAYRF